MKLPHIEGAVREPLETISPSSPDMGGGRDRGTVGGRLRAGLYGYAGSRREAVRSFRRDSGGTHEIF